MAGLCKLFRRYKVLEEKFQQLIAHSYSPDAESKGGARSARKKPSFVVHMDAEPPVWLTESI